MTDAARFDSQNDVDVLTSLLARLPVAVPDQIEPIITGLLLPTSHDRVRIAVADRALEFSQEAVVSVRLLEDDTVVAGTVELTLIEGATLLAVHPADAFRELLRGRRPFAFSARDRTPATSTSSARYRELEQNYLERRGLFVDS